MAITRVYVPTISNTYQLQQQLNTALENLYDDADAHQGTVTKVDTGTGLTGGPITTTGTIALADTAVTAGKYTSADLTIDKQGRITSAANGSAGTVTKIDTGSGLSGGPITTTGTVTLDLGHANNWTAQQNFASKTGIGNTSPAQALDVTGIVNSAYEYRLGNQSYTRAAIADAGGGWFGGYNVKGDAQPATTIETDSKGTAAAAYFDSSGVSIITTPTVAAGTNLAGNRRLQVDNVGNVVAGIAGTTSMTDGFLYVPAGAGAPAGTPTGYSGFAPLYVDTNANKLYFYSSGAWRDAGP